MTVPGSTGLRGEGRRGDVGYDFFVVLDGLVETVAGGRRFAVHGPLRFLGELSLLEGQPAFYGAVVVEPGEVPAVLAEKVRQASRRIPPSAT